MTEGMTNALLFGAGLLLGIIIGYLRRHGHLEEVIMAQSSTVRSLMESNQKLAEQLRTSEEYVTWLHSHIMQLLRGEGGET